MTADTPRFSRRDALRAATGLLAGAAIASLGACARRSGQHVPALAAALQGLTAEFMQLWLRGARAHPAIVRGLATLTVFDGRLDALNQANQLETIVTQRYAAILLVPVDVEAETEPARHAKEAGIPVIGSNTLLSDKSVYASYIGSDDVEGGRLVARAVVSGLRGRGNVVILEGPIGQSAQIQRSAGIQDLLNGYPGVKVLETRSANWSRAEAITLMENWLTAHPGEINGVIAQNDEMALGALEAIKARSLDPASLHVAGIDGISDALEAVKRGEMSTTLQDARAQSQGAIDLALRRLLGPTYTPLSSIWKDYAGQLDWGDGTRREFRVPWVPVTRDNVDRLIAMRKH